MKVYLDHNATTPLHVSVKGALMEAFSFYENPSSAYSSGTKVKSAVNNARDNCAALINAKADEIIFTSGGSESNNTVLGFSFINQLFVKNKSRREIIVSAIEHPSVMNCAKALERNGVVVHFAPVDRAGRIIIDKFEALLSEKTALVSIMLANNELGTIQEIKKLACTAHKFGAFFHTDAVQAAGKIPIDVKELDVDYLSFSGHKFYGPKGIGVLFIKGNSPFIPLIYGGKQEENRRSGTENILGIIGIGKAAEIAKINQEDWYNKLSYLKKTFIKGLKNSVENITINGDLENSLPQTINVSFRGTEAEIVQLYLDEKGIEVSTGSACSSGTSSKILAAIGLDKKTADSSIRFSLGIENTEEQIDYTIDALQEIITKLRYS